MCDFSDLLPSQQMNIALFAYLEEAGVAVFWSEFNQSSFTVGNRPVGKWRVGYFGDGLIVVHKDCIGDWSLTGNLPGRSTRELILVHGDGRFFDVTDPGLFDHILEVVE